MNKYVLEVHLDLRTLQKLKKPLTLQKIKQIIMLDIKKQEVVTLIKIFLVKLCY